MSGEVCVRITQAVQDTDLAREGVTAIRSNGRWAIYTVRIRCATRAEADKLCAALLSDSGPGNREQPGAKISFQLCYDDTRKPIGSTGVPQRTPDYIQVRHPIGHASGHSPEENRFCAFSLLSDTPSKARDSTLYHAADKASASVEEEESRFHVKVVMKIATNISAKTHAEESTDDMRSMRWCIEAQYVTEKGELVQRKGYSPAIEYRPRCNTQYKSKPVKRPAES